MVLPVWPRINLHMTNGCTFRPFRYFFRFSSPRPERSVMAYGWSDPLSQSRKCALFSVHSHQDRYRPGPAPFMTDIGTSQARRLAADDVLFMQQITGDTGSGLQGYAPDAFLTFRVFRACEEASGERGALKTFLWHAVFLQRNLRTLTMSVSGWPAISSPCRSDEEPKFFPFPLSLYHWFLFTNWYSTYLISDICPFSLSLQYHNPITGNLDGEQAFRLYISVY